MNPQKEQDNTDTPSGVFQFTELYIAGFTLCGLLWVAFLAIVGIQANIENYNVQVFVISLVTGLVIQITIFNLKKIRFLRFYNPVTNTDLQTMFEEVKAELGKGRGIELWSCNLDSGIFLSSTNPLLRAILLSENAISRILENREKAKIVLAREILLRERATPVSVVIISIFYFTLIPCLMLLNPLWYLPFELLILLLLIVIIVSFLALIHDPDLTHWSRHVDQVVQEKYGISPTAAIVEVFKGFSIADDAIDQQKLENVQRKFSQK